MIGILMNTWYRGVWYGSKSWLSAHPKILAVGFALIAGVMWKVFEPRWTPVEIWTRWGAWLKDRALAAFVAWVGIALAVLAAQILRSKVHVQGASKTPERITPDRPIESSAEDAFSLSSVAQQLALDVQLPADCPSVVLGLEGVWGCGKSSLLALVIQQLSTAPARPIVVRFNPWSLPRTDDLPAALLEAIATSIGDRQGRGPLERELRGLQQDLDRLTSLDQGSLRWWIASTARRLLGIGNSVVIVRRKDAVSDAIAKLGVPVVVFIDDIDRLQPGDICNAFRLLHEVIDFRRVCYVLAYDPIPIHQALAANPGDIDSGRRYKEKIVQVGIQFPRLSPTRLRQYANDLMLEGLKRHEVVLPDSEAARWEQALTICHLMLQTPRALKQAANKIAITARLLMGEVCVSDIAVFEALYQRNPQLIQRLKTYPELLFQLHQHDEPYSPVTMEVMGNTASGDAPKQALTRLLALDMIEDAQAQARATVAVRFLFPTAFKLKGSSKDISAAGQIDDPNNFLKLLCLGLQPGNLSDAAARDFIDRPERRADILGDFTSPLQIAEFLRHTAQFLPNAAIPEPRGLIEELLKTVDVWFDTEGQSLTDDVAVFVVVLIDKSDLEDAGERLALLQFVSTGAKRLSTGSRVLIDAFKHLGLLMDGVWQPDRGGRSSATGEWQWLAPQQANQVRKEWIQRFDSEAWDAMVASEPDFIGLLYRRAQYDQNDYTRIQVKLRELLASSDEAARQFVKPYAGYWAVDSLNQFVPDIHWLLQRLTQVKADSVAIEKIREHFETQLPTDATGISP